MMHSGRSLLAPHLQTLTAQAMARNMTAAAARDAIIVADGPPRCRQQAPLPPSSGQQVHVWARCAAAVLPATQSWALPLGAHSARQQHVMPTASTVKDSVHSGSQVSKYAG